MTFPIKVTVLTGFLGAGKTTLLNHLLRDPAMARTAVVVNEFGEAGLDHLLIEGGGEDIVELSNGCICCTVRGEMVDRLAELVDRMQTGRMSPVDRLVIETSGLADPSPVLAALMAHPALSQAYALDGVVTLVDAAGGVDILKQRVEAQRQVAVADRIVLTKTDLGGPDAALVDWLNHMNPGAVRLDAARGEATAAALTNAGVYDAETRTARLAEWLGDGACDCTDPNHHHHHHDARGHGPLAAMHGPVASLSLVDDAPLPIGQVEEFVNLLQSLYGDRLLRLKAMVYTREHPDKPLVLHGVRRYMHPPAFLPAWPATIRPHSRFVLIAEDLDERPVRDLFAAFTGKVGTDVADRAALTDNPLAIPGLSRFS